MALEPHAQFLEAAKRGQRLLVALPHGAGVDETAAALVLASLLRAEGKTVDVVGDGFRALPEHALLPDAETVRPSLPGLQTFVISVPLADVQLHDLDYRVADDRLRITLTPKADNWSPDQVRAETGASRYDLAITVGAPDLESLGATYRAAPDFWRSVPIVNLDHSPANERFGVVNLVDIAATSVSEVLYDLLLARAEGAALDRAQATALLAGVIAKTRSFKTENVSPKTLAVAADLVGRGADRQRIIHELYRTRTVATLRLWGRALTRLRHDTGHGIVWAVLTRQDFIAAGARDEELPGVLEELIATSPDVAVSFILHEEEGGGVRGLLHAGRGADALAIARPWSPTGSPRQAAFTMPGVALLDAERLVLDRAKAATRDRR